jgi:hypothetical protein
MKWTKRIHCPGTVYLAMAHGVNGRDIFMNDQDRSVFSENIQRIASESGAEVLAVCLLRDRFYVAIRVATISLAAIMRRLLTGYATAFNRRHGRTGHLFQARYRAHLCQDHEDAAAMIRAGDDPFERWPKEPPAKVTPLRRTRGTHLELDRIGEAIANRTNIAVTELRSTSSRRPVVAAKRLLAQEAIRQGESMKDIARWLKSSLSTLTRYARHQSENIERTDTI